MPAKLTILLEQFTAARRREEVKASQTLDKTNLLRNRQGGDTNSISVWNFMHTEVDQDGKTWIVCGLGTQACPCAWKTKFFSTTKAWTHIQKTHMVIQEQINQIDLEEGRVGTGARSGTRQSELANTRNLMAVEWLSTDHLAITVLTGKGFKRLMSTFEDDGALFTRESLDKALMERDVIDNACVKGLIAKAKEDKVNLMPDV